MMRSLKNLGNYRDLLVERLASSPQLCINYVSEALADEDAGVLLIVLSDVIDAHGGIKNIARQSGVPVRKMQQIFKEELPLDITTLAKIIRAFGWSLLIKQAEKVAKKGHSETAKIQAKRKGTKGKSISPGALLPAKSNDTRSQPCAAKKS